VSTTRTESLRWSARCDASRVDWRAASPPSTGLCLDVILARHSVADRRRLVPGQADLAARGPGIDDLGRGVPRRLIEGSSNRFPAERALYIDRALAPAIALGAVSAVRPMAPINTEHEVGVSLAREALKAPPNEKSHILSGSSSIAYIGGGGGSRTRVREYAVAGIYMRSRS